MATNARRVKRAFKYLQKCFLLFLYSSSVEPTLCDAIRSSSETIFRRRPHWSTSILHCYDSMQLPKSYLLNKHKWVSSAIRVSLYLSLIRVFGLIFNLPSFYSVVCKTKDYAHYPTKCRKKWQDTIKDVNCKTYKKLIRQRVKGASKTVLANVMLVESAIERGR